MKGPTPRRLLRYVTGRLRGRPYREQPGDGRPQPQIPARVLVWALLLSRLLRETSFHGVEQWVRSSGCRALALAAGFGDDALAYFTERLEAGRTRAALLDVLRRAKRNKAFDDCRFIGLAIDGTSAGRSASPACELCRPFRNARKEVAGYRHHFAAIRLVGAGLSLPFDVEPYGPGDSEYAAEQRLLARARQGLGARFAQYLVVDGNLATAPFLHAADQAGLPVVARLKGNLPEFAAAVEKRFSAQPPAGSIGTARTAWRPGMPTTSIPERPSPGRRCG